MLGFFGNAVSIYYMLLQWLSFMVIISVFCRHQAYMSEEVVFSPCPVRFNITCVCCNTFVGTSYVKSLAIFFFFPTSESNSARYRGRLQLKLLSYFSEEKKLPLPKPHPPEKGSHLQINIGCYLSYAKWVYLTKCTPSRYIYVPTSIDRVHICTESYTAEYIYVPSRI